MLATGLVHSQISIRTSVEIGAFQSPILPIYVVRADKSHVDHMATQNASHYPRRWFLFETPDRSANLGPNILKEKQYRHAAALAIIRVSVSEEGSAPMPSNMKFRVGV